MKKTLSCVYCRIRSHWVVLWQRGHVRVLPAPSEDRFVPYPKRKNIGPA
jgi:hypothetical protein